MADTPAAPPPSGPPSTSAAPTPAPAKADATAKAEGGEATKAAPPVPQRYKMDLGEGEREYELGELKANYLKGKNHAQLATKADQKLQQAQALERNHNEFKELLTKDALKAFKAMGLDKKQAIALAEQILLPEVQSQMMTEEQRRIAHLEAQLQEQAERDKEREAKAREAEFEELTKTHLDALSRQAVEAIEKSGLPKETAPWAVKRLAALMERSQELELGLTADDCARLVKEDFAAEHQAMQKAMPFEQWMQWVGEERIKEMRAYDLARLKEKHGKPAQAASPAIAAPRTNGSNNKALTRAEWDELIKQRIGG